MNAFARTWLSNRLAWACPAAVLCVLLVCQRARSADDEVKQVPRTAVVHVYPEKLTPADTLTDGDKGKPIEITGETTLIWVDLMPDARYQHDTEYVLISPRGTRVIKGGWWPVLNGKAILRGEPEARVPFPVEVTEK